MHIPKSTYRIQFTPTFGFGDLAHILDYLKALGISDIYASPIFQSRQGSDHGYDVVNPKVLNPELGNEKVFDALISDLHEKGMSWIQDIVPNHMAFDSQNDMLMDALENGPHSEFYPYFDIQLEHHYERMENKVLAPLLGKFYGECLENGELKLQYDREGLSINYYDNRFPLNVESYFDFFTYNQESLQKELGTDHPDYVKYLGILYAVKNLPDTTEPANRYDQIQFIKRMLWELYQSNKEIRKFIKSNIYVYNGTVGEPESFDLLHDLLQEQHFRLAFWKVGTEEINYRRFFTVNDLISLRIDNEQVFEDTHSLAFRMLSEDKFQGLRIDHVDGLYNPNQYLQRLRNRYHESYLVVEKILEQTEKIPDFWPVQGTTGYDFMNFVNGLFTRKQNRSKFNKIYRKFVDYRTSYSELLQDKKRLIIGKHMAGDVDNLAHTLFEIAGNHRYGSDFTLYGLRRALVEILAWFPVYRTYFNEYGERSGDADYVEEARRYARAEMPDLIREIDFICKVLCLQFGEHQDEKEQFQWIHFVKRFQQLTGPLMAKGFEDTVLYIYNRLLSLNEVGSNPENFGISDIEFHHYNRESNKAHPHSMNATSTHDSKKGEDVRARLNVLSEIPDEWEQLLNRWHKLNLGKKGNSDGVQIPDSNDEYFLYQILLGTYPFGDFDQEEYLNRVREYIVKAVREAKRHTAWLEPDTKYEEGFVQFLFQIFQPDDDNNFLPEFHALQQKLAHFGVINSLSMTLLKITVPGVPDFYQGSELWNFSMVDPDNRRPVDYERRFTYLKAIQDKLSDSLTGLIEELLNDPADGRIKLFLIHKLLTTRNTNSDLFQYGDYSPLKIEGLLKEHVFAFFRETQKAGAVVVIPRFLTGRLNIGEYPLGTEFWMDTSIPLDNVITQWHNVIPDEKIRATDTLKVGEILNHFPVGLVIGQK